MADLLAFPQNVQSPEKPLLSLQHSVEQENLVQEKNTRSSLISGKKVLCQVSFLRVFFSIVTVNPLELNLMPNDSTAEIPSIVDFDVPGSCFINKIDLEEQDPQHRKSIKSSNLNDNEVLYLIFLFPQHNHIPKKVSSVFVGYESEGNCQIDELKREISGLSQLASELYSVTQTSDTDRVSLDRYKA